MISLGLPDTYLAMDPTTVRLTSKDRVQEMRTNCKTGKPRDTRAAEAIKLNIKATEESLSSLKSQARPDVYLETRLAANGVDNDSGKSFSESLSLDHPQWSFAVGLEWPIGFDAEKADLLDSLSRKTQLEASLSQTLLDQKVERINACAKLRRESEKVKAFKTAVTKQKKRNQLEERRFELGQVPLLNVIQSGNDITAAEVSLQSAETEVQKSAWNIVKANGTLIDYIENAVKTIAVKGTP